MKRFVVVHCVLALVGVWTASAGAWEFFMTAEYELRCRYFSRSGPNDLFGNVDDAQVRDWAGEALAWPLVTSIGFSGPSHRYVQIEGFSSKGSDAAYAEQRFWCYPEFKVNRAISVKGIFALSGNLNAMYNPPSPPQTSPGGTGEEVQADHYIPPSENWATNPHHAGWIMLDSRDIVRGVGMAAPIVHAFWAEVRLPWGMVVLGRRPAGFGMGWVAHRDDNYATSLSVIASYGPLTFVFSQYLHDSGEDTDQNDYANRFADFRHLTPDIVYVPLTVASAVDQNEGMDWNQACAVIYSASSFQLGAMARFVRWSNVHTASDRHNVPPPPYQLIGTLRDDALYPTLAVSFPYLSPNFTAWLIGNVRYPVLPGPIFRGVTSDLFFLLGSVYFKYFNGAFSLSAEYDYQVIEARRKGSRPVSGFPQAWALEMAYLAGPLKLSLAHFYRSGHDRRGYYFYPTTDTSWPSYDRWNLFLTAWGGGEGPIRPYSFLLGVYGAGNSSYNSAGNCTYKDFLAYAARIDYALAANLNLFASFIHAERASNTGTPRGNYDGWLWRDRSAGDFPFAFWQGTVPDNHLGFEVDVGLDWKLLEGLRLKVLCAYWQPGNWFKWAYVDRSRTTSLNSQPTGPGRHMGEANPGRVIDPIFGIQSSVLIEF